MTTVETPETPHKRRRADSVVVNVTFDREAVAILKKFCPTGTKGTGRLLGRLLYEHQARQDERQRLQQRLGSVIEEGEGQE
jgi:hypothetical protein